MNWFLFGIILGILTYNNVQAFFMTLDPLGIVIFVIVAAFGLLCLEAAIKSVYRIIISYLKGDS